MPNLFELFKYSKMLELKDGRIGLMGVSINITPTSILRDLQKGLVEATGFRKAYENIYLSAKNGSMEYNKNFIKKQNFSDKRKIIDWQKKIVTFAGWGEVVVAEIDFEKNEYIAHFKNSPFPEIYGKANYHIDIIPAGFIAGAFEAGLNKKLDCLETKCIATGSTYCEFKVAAPEKIKKEKAELWKKLKI
ncbi:MAG: V4R domain-containing protein [Candidatus Diapherotrites archaeon]